jgi:serine/threonine-protein kinase HipA
LPQEDFCQALGVPPGRKYQSDGGPGIRDISDALQGSDAPDEDRRIFFKAVLAFWLLGATDGHAKNFSVRLSSGGRFRLTPLYDILSTQPGRDANHIRQNQFKLAMSVGNNRHYVVDQIQARHFHQTADACGLPIGLMEALFQELEASVPVALESTCNAMPDDFPDAIAVGRSSKL